jgi:abhydrolase domain-containing protein 12
MPWQETEALFLSTIRAAQEVSQDHSSSKNLQIIDLGEAGKQEGWQTGSISISKTIAKHGGTYYDPFP